MRVWSWKKVCSCRRSRRASSRAPHWTSTRHSSSDSRATSPPARPSRAHNARGARFHARSPVPARAFDTSRYLPRFSSLSSHASSLARHFAGWKGALERVHRDVLAYFANFVNGMELLKQALTQRPTIWNSDLNFDTPSG